MSQNPPSGIALTPYSVDPSLLGRRVDHSLLDGDEVEDRLDIVQLEIIRRPRAAEVEADLVLGLADHTVLDDPEADECGQQSEHQHQDGKRLK